MKRILTIVLAALTIWLPGSCKKEDQKVSVTDVSLDKTELTLTVGDQPVQLTATVAPDNATDKTVSWASDKKDITAVDQNGKVSAVAPGEATITVTTTDGSKTATCKVTVKAALPAGALAGEFSVSATKKVHFSQGNLYYDGSAFKFETDQYEIQASWSTSHVSHFYWSKTASVAYAENYSDSGDGSDVYFTNQNGFKVNVGGKDQEGWRTLSKDEWQYLFKTRTNATRLFKYGVSVCDKADCLVIAPDGFTGTIETSYDASSWPAAEAAGLVCLPAAGYRNGSSVSRVGFSGNYWSSSPSSSNRAIRVDFDSSSVFADLANRRDVGYSVRLVTDIK